VEFTDIDRDCAGPFAKEIKARGAYPANGIYDFTEEDNLALYEALHDGGFITHEEFAKAKRRLLGLLHQRGRSDAPSRRPQ
jgi:hypothetical protein